MRNMGERTSSECTGAILTRRPLYVEEFMTHVAANLSIPNPVLHTFHGCRINFPS